MTWFVSHSVKCGKCADFVANASLTCRAACDHLDESSKRKAALWSSGIDGGGNRRSSRSRLPSSCRIPVPATAAAVGPSLRIVLVNDAYETLAVDSSGIAYGRPTGSLAQIWRSADEGRTWAQLRPSRATIASGTSRRSTAGRFSQRSMSGSYAVFRSGDGGSTWTRVLTLPEFAVLLLDLDAAQHHRRERLRLPRHLQRLS